MAAEARPELHWQPTLLGCGTESVDGTFSGLVRAQLDTASWVDHQHGFVSGSDALFERLVDGAQWRQPEVTMYERRLRQPRLTAHFPFDDSAPDEPAIGLMRAALDSR